MESGTLPRQTAACFLASVRPACRAHPHAAAVRHARHGIPTGQLAQRRCASGGSGALVHPKPSLVCPSGGLALHGGPGPSAPPKRTGRCAVSAFGGGLLSVFKAGDTGLFRPSAWGLLQGGGPQSLKGWSSLYMYTLCCAIASVKRLGAAYIQGKAAILLTRGQPASLCMCTLSIRHAAVPSRQRGGMSTPCSTNRLRRLPSQITQVLSL